MKILVNIVPEIEKIHPEEPERLTIDMTLNSIEDIDSDMLHREFFEKHKETLKSEGEINVIVKGAKNDRYDQACAKVVKYLEYSEITVVVTWEREGETAEADTFAKARLSRCPTVTRKHVAAGTAAAAGITGLVVSLSSPYNSEINGGLSFNNKTNNTLGLSPVVTLGILTGAMPVLVYGLFILTVIGVLTDEERQNVANKGPKFNALAIAAAMITLVSTLEVNTDPSDVINPVVLAIFSWSVLVLGSWFMSGRATVDTTQDGEGVKSTCKLVAMSVAISPEFYLSVFCIALALTAALAESDVTSKIEKGLVESLASLVMPTGMLLLQALAYHFNDSYRPNGNFGLLAAKFLPTLFSFSALAFYSAEQKFVASEPSALELRVLALFAPTLVQAVIVRLSDKCSKHPMPEHGAEEAVGLLTKQDDSSEENTKSLMQQVVDEHNDGKDQGGSRTSFGLTASDSEA